MKLKKTAIVSLLMILPVLSCIFSDKVKDIDGNKYKTIKIGSQLWMAENLKVTHYRNGDPIPNVTDRSEWGALTTGAYCNYDNNEANTEIYGRFYNWYAINDRRNIAPKGWHVPTDIEWKEFELYLGVRQSEIDNVSGRGINIGGKLKETGTVHWESPNTGATNESDFTALPGGISAGSAYSFSGMGKKASFWSSTAYDNRNALFRQLVYDNTYIIRFSNLKQWGLSVRCVKD